MPPRKIKTNNRNVLPRNTKDKNSGAKIESDCMENRTASKRREFPGDNDLQNEIMCQVVAEIHANDNSTNSVQVAALSDSKIIELLENSQTLLDFNDAQPGKIVSSTVCSSVLPQSPLDISTPIQSFNTVSKMSIDYTNTISVAANGAVVFDNEKNDEIVTCIESAPTTSSVTFSPSIISNYAQEVTVRTSNDPENKIIEEIDISPDAEEPLDRSTPIECPSILTIMQNIESGTSSFNINTPTSSLCANLTNNDDTYIAPSNSDTTNIDDSNFEDSQTKKKRNVKKHSKLGKIRKVNKTEWIDSKRKHLRNTGLSYVSRNGKVRSEKSLLPACDDKCRLKCKEKIGQDIRIQMFKEYWSLGDRIRQWEFLVRWCKQFGKKRITTEAPSKRQFSVSYYLPKNVGDVITERVTVCKTMFLHTFAIGEGVVRTAIKKMSEGNGLSVDRDERGRHNNHPKVKTEEMIKSVINHVKSFTPVESHYTRKESSKLFLDSELTMTKMFKLYKEWVPEADVNKAKTVRQYTDIVNENLNIEFHRPKKDQCDVCIAYKNCPKPVNMNDHERFSEHLRNKDMARTLKNEDKLSAINSPNTIVTAAFDFQKVHSSPHAETSILYYKRKLNVFNFTIFEMGQKLGKCYMWHEGTAKRGANEVASCVYDFIKEQSAKGIQTVNLYSDNCGGQNRNRIVFMMYLIAAKEFNVSITHRFLEKGHTQNENDSIHALIERCSKNKQIYTPDQWFALVRWAKESGDPYTVKEIAADDIIDFKKLLPGKNWTKDDKNLKVVWTKIREVHVSSSEPDILTYKTNFDETSRRLFVRRSQNRRRQNQLDDELTPAYTGPLPIPSAKLIDLKYLCEHNIIPKQYHGFYASLVSGEVIVSSSEEEE